MSTAAASPAPALEVLVVEDEEDLAEALVRLLTLEGWAVRGAGDGATALRLARERTPALAVLDVVLPDTTGLRC